MDRYEFETSLERNKFQVSRGYIVRQCVKRTILRVEIKSSQYESRAQRLSHLIALNTVLLKSANICYLSPGPRCESRCPELNWFLSWFLKSEDRERAARRRYHKAGHALSILESSPTMTDTWGGSRSGVKSLTKAGTLHTAQGAVSGWWASAWPCIVAVRATM